MTVLPSPSPLEDDLVSDQLDPAPTLPRRFLRFQADRSEWVDGSVITEIRLTIILNDRELVSLMCSPWRVRELVIGFLTIEGFITDVDDIELLRVCLEDRLAEVRLRSLDVVIPTKRILTSGCTGGQTFGAYLQEIERFRVGPSTPVSADLLYSLMRELYRSATLYRRAGGVHTSILAGASGVLIVAEDIGRHNTLDKIQGEALLRKIDTHDRFILTSGRISSEMLLKAAVMGVSLVASRTSPTALALTLAERLNITVIGYIRAASMNVYTVPERLLGAEARL